MSVTVTDLIWKSGCYEGSILLVAIALGDYASKDGYRVFPTIASLAQKARCNERTARRALRMLEEDGIIVRENSGNGGRGHVTNYVFDLERLAVCPPSSEKGGLRRPERGAGVHTMGGVDDKSPTPPYIDNRQENRQENRQGKGTNPKEGLVDQALEVFNLIATEVGWIKSKALTKGRVGALAQRIRQAGGIEGWRNQIYRARSSKMMCGSNRRGWVPNLDFFLSEDNFQKLMEGSYDNRDPKKGGYAPSDGTVSEEALRNARINWLEKYGMNGEWCQNISKNGQWKDKFGIGAPPHHPETLITPGDLTRVPAAKVMMERIKKYKQTGAMA